MGCLTIDIQNGFARFQLNKESIRVGYGALKSEAEQFQQVVQLGIRLVDGALGYNDAPKLRSALEEKDVTQLAYASKISGNKIKINDLKNSTEAALHKILGDSGKKSLEIVYLHGPDCLHKETLDVLKEAKEEGLVQHIGLSNVTLYELKAVLKAGYSISTIQNEFNPQNWDSELLEFCHEQGIVFVGYRPFGGDALKVEEAFKNEILQAIAERVQSAVSTVILQWAYQKGVTAIPHSNNSDRILLNAMVPNWTLSAEDIVAIDQIREKGKSLCGWQKFIVPDLLARSKEWIARL